MVFTACKRRWKKLGFQFVGLLCYVGVLYAAGMVYRGYELARYHEGLFRVAVKLPNPLFFYDSSRDFHGDGYSIDVYDLPKAIRNRFEKFDEKEMEEYPRKPDYRSKWKVSRWHRTPATKEDVKYVDFALHWHGSDEVTRFQRAIRTCVSNGGSYVAYFYQDFGQRTENVDLYIVDLAGDRLYSINLNL